MPISSIRRRGFGLRLIGAVATAVLASGFVVAMSPAAEAVTGFHTSASGVRVRAGASTLTTQIGTITYAGTAVDIACQLLGQSVTASGFGTSAVWDRLNGYGNGYVSDLFIQETVYAAFDPRIPRCDTPAPVVTREQKALTWAYGQLGHYTDDWGRATSGWCARWSVGAYGRMNSGYSTAYTMYLAFRSMGLTHTGVAPAGTFVFFASAAINGYAGHVAIADGTGGMITTSSTYIKHTALSYAGATYLGWSYAPAGWTR